MCAGDRRLVGPADRMAEHADRSQLRPGTERVRKSERLEKVVIGKTANREAAIKTDLVGLGIVSEGQEICGSPQQDPADASEILMISLLPLFSLFCFAQLSRETAKPILINTFLEDIPSRGT